MSTKIEVFKVADELHVVQFTREHHNAVAEWKVLNVMLLCPKAMKAVQP